MKPVRTQRFSAPFTLTASLVPALLIACSAVGDGTTGVEDTEPVEGLEQAIGSFPGFVTSIKPYVVAMTPEYSVQALLSSGDRVPRTSNPAQSFQMIGIPDGMGAYQAQGSTVLFMNHELGNTSLAEPI